MTINLVKDRRGHTRRWCKARGRDWMKKSEPPETERCQEGFSLGNFRRIMALLTPCVWTSDLQNSERINFYYFKPPKFMAIGYGCSRKLIHLT
jgi:hypothetical protein